MAEALILTVDNGGTNTRIALGGEEIGQIAEYDTPENYEKAIGHIAATARVVLDGRRPDAVGFSVAGKVENGRIVSAGQLQEYGWTGHPFAADVAEELGVSPDRVVLLNDCAAGANAECIARQPKDGEAGAFMVLSTGFGGALYTAREVETGFGNTLYMGHELIADEPGHEYLRPGAICGDGVDGHMEAHVSGSGIARKFGMRGEHIPHDDPRWEEIKGDFHESMARTLRRYETELDMSLRIVGFTGSVALGGPDMLGSLQHDLDIRMGAAAPRIEQAVYRDESGLYGASFAAAQLLQGV